MNSDEIKNVLLLVEEVFGKPEVGAHAFMTGPFHLDEKQTCLKLQIKVGNGFRPLEFDPGEEITRESLMNVKAIMDSNPTSTEWIPTTVVEGEVK